VLFVLRLKAECEGVGGLSLRQGANYCFSVKNPLSDFETREKIVVDSSEFVEQDESSRDSPCHFQIRWEGAKKFSTMTILTEAEAKTALKKAKKKKFEEFLPRPLTDSDNGEFVPVLIIEARGVEPYGFHPLGNEFIVKSEGGAEFAEDVDLTDDWADYDEEHDAPIGVNELESDFISI